MTVEILIELVIPNHEEELETLERIGNAGFILGLGLRFGKPDFLLNRYPDAWTQQYERENYIFGDPMVVWTMARTGSIRWSECSLPDLRGVMGAASRHGLNYGATFVDMVRGKRSFLSIARNDRELTDAEMAVLMGRIQIWAKLFTTFRKTLALTSAELDALAAIKSGANQDDAAKSLNISRSALRLRLTSAQVKLRAPNTVSAVARAAQMHLI